MAYVLRYTGELKDHFNRTIRVDISEDGYTGDSTEVKLKGISKEWNGSDDDLFIGRIGSAVGVGFLSETNFQFIDLYSSDSRKFKMQIYINSVLDWRGWIIPDLFTEKYDAPPYKTIISARDGLAELDSISFELTGMQNQVVILQEIFGKIGDPTVHLGINVFEENHSTSNSPLLQTYVDCERYEGMSCGEVLEDLMDGYNARVYQQAGDWWFMRVPEFEEGVDWIKYNIFGSPTSDTKNTELLIGRPKEDKFARVDQQLNFLPAWKSQNINIDLGLKESFIKNWGFDDWTKTGYVTRRNPIYEPDYWDGTASVRRSVGDDLYMFFTSNNSTPVLYRKQTVEGEWKNTESPLVFNVNYAIQQDVVGPQPFGEFWIKIMITSASSIKWLNSLGGWETSETFINIENIPQSKSYEFKTLSITSDGIPIDGELSVFIHPSDTGNLGINEFKGEYLTIDRNKFPEDFDYNKTVNVNNNYIPDEVRLLTADFQDVDNDTDTPSDELINEKFVYFGGLFLDADKESITQVWQTKKVIDTEGFVNGDKLQNIIFDDKKSRINIAQWAVSGTILSKNMQIDSTIVDYQIINKKYLVCNGTLDMENCMFNGTFIEVGIYSGAPWILADGTWNDNGVWIDTEVWNDSAP